jgi:Dihydrodipicolinate synthetase family
MTPFGGNLRLQPIQCEIELEHVDSWLAQKAEGAPLTAALFRDTSPAPLKYALSLLGLMLPKLRLPLVELTRQTKAEVAAVTTQVCEGYANDVIGQPRETGANERLAVVG